MASVTFYLGVRPEQRKFRRFGVIELDGWPSLRRVASLAFGTIPSAMDVLQAVAGDAGCRQILIAFTDMAGRADHFSVRAFERKLRFRMVERFGAPPRLFTVASITFLTKVALVRIGFLVAADALTGRIAELYSGHMAPRATDLPMGPFDFEIREGVVECLPVQLDNIHAASLVVGMAGPAFSGTGICAPSVKSALLLTIRRDFFVTRQAQLRLTRFGERLVAIGTVFFQPGVPLDQWPWHDHTLVHRLRLHATRWCKGQQDADGAADD
jgi:hypothetical protein